MKCTAIKSNGFPCQTTAQENGLCGNHNRAHAQKMAKEEQKTSESLVEEKAKIPEKISKIVKVETQAAILKRAKTRREARKAQSVRLGRLPGQKLVAPTRHGYHRHWANDVGSRLDDMQDKGYTFVTPSVDGDENIRSTDVGTRTSQVVDQKKGGGEITAYLMERPEEWFREDQQEKEKRRYAREAQIKRGLDDGQGIGQPGSNLYNPVKGRNQMLDG